jgi:hypothetical protein
VRLSGIAGVFGTIVNGIYTPTDTMNCLMPVYKKEATPSATDPPTTSSNKDKPPMETFLVFDDNYGPKSKAAWLVRTANGKVYARAVLPSGAPRCFPQELYMSADGKYRRSDVMWEMKSSVKVFGFRVRPAGAVHVLEPTATAHSKAASLKTAAAEAAPSSWAGLTLSALSPSLLRDVHDPREEVSHGKDEVPPCFPASLISPCSRPLEFVDLSAYLHTTDI